MLANLSKPDSKSFPTPDHNAISGTVNPNQFCPDHDTTRAAGRIIPQIKSSVSALLMISVIFKCHYECHLIVTDDPDNLMVLTTNNSGTEAE